MSAYFAIIRDSFREALASRVLWVLLIAITLVLLALAPFGYREQRTLALRGPFDLLQSRALAKKIRLESFQPSPAQQIWRRWDEATRKKVAEFISSEGREGQKAGVLVDGLNQIIEGDDVYSEDAWKDLWLDAEAKQLLAKPFDELEPDDRKRRNLLLLEAAYRDNFRPRPDNEVVLTYLYSDITPVAFAGRGLDVKQFREILLRRIVINLLIKFFIGIVALFAAILVTSPIIPQMFEVGSLHLLLSKPVNRSLMFLSKFLGGCAFIFFNVSYLLVGFWLIAGLRFDEWNQGLLLCIPIFLFLFALYYSISALSGVIWKSAVMSVVMTVVFWFVCFIVESVKSVIEAQVAINQRLVAVCPVPDGFVGRNEVGEFTIWDEAKNQWQTTKASGLVSFVADSPVFLPKSNRVAAILGAPRMPFNFNAGNQLAFGGPDSGWSLEKGISLPNGSLRLLVGAQEKLLVFGEFGLREYQGPLEAQESMKFMGFELPSLTGEPLRDVGPESGWRPPTPAMAAIDTSQDQIAVLSKNKVLVLQRRENEQRYRIVIEGDLPDDDQTSPGDIAIAGEYISVARSNGKLTVLKTDSLETVLEVQPGGDDRPRFVRAASDGSQFLTAYHKGRLLSWSPSQTTWTPAKVEGQGEISAASFTDNGELAIIDRWDRLTLYLPNGAIGERLAPAPTTLQTVFRYVIRPLYAVFPKPQALDNTVQYVLSNDDEITLDDGNARMADLTQTLHPWRPVRDSAIFMALVLGAACFYIQRQDF